MYLIPGDLLRKFESIASGNYSANGRHIETLAYLFGYENDGNLFGTHLIFPEQEGTCSKVDDKGNFRKDIQWLKNLSVLAIYLIKWTFSTKRFDG